MSVPIMASKSSSLQLGHNISFMSEPQTHPTQSSSKVLVIGGGVTGLITAWVLLDRGYQVTIVSKQWTSYDKEQRLTSQIAAALWEYPPAVCGQHTDPTSLIRSKEWCMTAYQIWEAIAADPALAKTAGVQMRKSIFFFPKSLVDTPTQLLKLGEIHGSGAHEVRRDVGLIEEMGVDLSCGAVDAYELLVPIIDTDKCMAWLMNLVQHKGACFVTETIRGDIFSEERSLLRRFNVGAIVNASGLASKELASDPSCYPLRGALLRFINDGKDFPKITAAMSIGADASLDNEIMFLVPRNDDILIAGGIAQRDEWYLDLTLDSPVVQRMRARCEAFLPCLKNARLDPEYPLAQGLRPGREKNIRVERDCRTRGGRQSRIVHSYGHGGSGWSLSFGCAEEVVALVEDVLQERDDLSELRCRL